MAVVAAVAVLSVSIFESVSRWMSRRTAGGMGNSRVWVAVRSLAVVKSRSGRLRYRWTMRGADSSGGAWMRMLCRVTCDVNLFVVVVIHHVDLVKSGRQLKGEKLTTILKMGLERG